MSVQSVLRNAINGAIGRLGYQLIRKERLYEWQLDKRAKPPTLADLPDGAGSYLTPDNPRLVELKERYAKLDPAVVSPALWTDDHVSPKALQYFRGETAYVWQERGGFSEFNYLISTYYALSIDTSDVLSSLSEDCSFGAFSYDIANKKISRDLLDSVLEFYFLKDALTCFDNAELTVLDIGAGYGRLAHRLTTLMPNIKTYLCADAVPTSTFICEYYIKYRERDSTVSVVPLDRIKRVLSDLSVDLAINIHSFSECALEAIDWWIRLCAENNIRYLMIAPNAEKEQGAVLCNNWGEEFLPVLERHGYQLLTKQPKYRDPLVQKYGIFPTYYHLLELHDEHSLAGNGHNHDATAEKE